MTETVIYSARDEMMKTHAAVYREQSWDHRGDYLAQLLELFGPEYVQTLLKSMVSDGNTEGSVRVQS